MEGKENGTITISAPAHTGRVARETAVTVQAANGAKPKANVTVKQAGAAVITTIDANTSDVPKGGGTLTINGTSNSSKLTWKIANPDTGEGLYPPGYGSATIAVNGVNISSGVVIPGDPGAASVYSFVATAVFAPSPFPIDGRMGLVVTDDTGHFKACAFIIKAGASTMSLSKNGATMPNSGGNDAIEVTSNDDWAVS